MPSIMTAPITPPRRSGWRRRARVGLALAGLALSPGVWAALGQSWNVDQAKVRVACPKTVGGSFEARTESLTGTVTLRTERPPSFSGALAVDLATLKTGIGLRDAHMRDNYLEIGKGEGFDKAVLSEIRLADVDPEAFEGHTTFLGTLELHGVTRPISGRAEVKRSDPGVHIKADFPIDLPDFGIPKPRYLGVGVKDRVTVHVAFAATPVAQAGGGQ